MKNLCFILVLAHCALGCSKADPKGNKQSDGTAQMNPDKEKSASQDGLLPKKDAPSKSHPENEPPPPGTTPKDGKQSNDAVQKNPGKEKGVPQDSSLPKKDGPSTSNPDKEPPPPGTTVIVAEGIGKNADESLKDAFRNAVRQAVGAVVDAETLVKNDEIISDKILTYSGGFVKSYDEVRKKQELGIFRTTIRATVESSSLVAKLKAASITLKNVDGKGLFAEAITREEAKKNAAVLVQKAFDGYPANVIQAEMIGKPRIKETSESEATIEYDLRVAVDIQKYETFAKRLVYILDKTSNAKGDMRAEASEEHWVKEHQQVREQAFVGTVFGYENRGRWPRVTFSPEKAIANTPTRLGFDRRLWWKNGQDLRTNIIVVVNTGRTGLDDRTNWSWYCIPRGWLSVPKGTAINISLTDKGGKLVLADNQIEFKRGSGGAGVFGPGLTVNDSSESFDAIASPYFVHNAYYWRHITITQQSKVAVGDVRNLDNIRCSVGLLKSTRPN